MQSADLFRSHTHRLSCGGRVILRSRPDGGTDIEVIGAVGVVIDPRPTIEVEADLRAQGLSVARM
jgi:hypothetical protein